MSQELTVLFLCTGNSCRSQMAEGWANALLEGTVRAHSAGTAPGTVDPRAVQVMAEAGVDISHHQSKPIDPLIDLEFDLVVTVCDRASESCPVFPGRARIVHHGFDDPPRLAVEASSEDEALDHYRRVRDEIRSFVERLPEHLSTSEEPRP